MATTQPGGLYKNASGRLVDANGRPAQRAKAEPSKAEPSKAASTEAPFDPAGRPALSGLKTAELEAVAREEGVDLAGASNNQERADLIEKARAESA